MSGLARPLSKEAVRSIHSAAIAKFGGLDGVRDEGLLESALAQPFQTFGGEDLYPTLAQKAARYAYGIASSHPFLDGNKRAAAAVMGAFLRLNGCCFRPRHDELLAIMMGVAGGSVSYDELSDWIQSVLREG
ncbi:MULTISPECIES: type II toxin-antitoxin system death-on-curing family toxin [unclassified Adlercreutzia]|uniref:type II toxin-antitoxin system death-on-curing family toxin n=1 Tax=unclassified Adlercreutzia TaxID=2636013 RepID=UPI0013EC6E00|nr:MULTISPECIES: type II toxin-antitoxin system death-on-curing family toxin [unclassified Adlercreutzia]